MIDRGGKFVVPPRFDILMPLSDDDLILVELDKQWGFIDRNGAIVIRPQLTSRPPFTMVWPESDWGHTPAISTGRARSL